MADTVPAGHIYESQPDENAMKATDTMAAETDVVKSTGNVGVKPEVDSSISKAMAVHDATDATVNADSPESVHMEHDSAPPSSATQDVELDKEATSPTSTPDTMLRDVASVLSLATLAPSTGGLVPQYDSTRESTPSNTPQHSERNTPVKHRAISKQTGSTHSTPQKRSRPPSSSGPISGKKQCTPRCSPNKVSYVVDRPIQDVPLVRAPKVAGSATESGDKPI